MAVVVTERSRFTVIDPDRNVFVGNAEGQFIAVRNIIRHGCTERKGTLVFRKIRRQIRIIIARDLFRSVFEVPAGHTPDRSCLVGRIHVFCKGSDHNKNKRDQDIEREKRFEDPCAFFLADARFLLNISRSAF